MHQNAAVVGVGFGTLSGRAVVAVNVRTVS